MRSDLLRRRDFLKLGSTAAMSLGYPSLFSIAKTHILTLSFDDGFKKSYFRIAELYEAYGLSACFNVIATGHFSDFKAVDQWILPELMGNFDDWTELVSRGHEVMPHSWQHRNLAREPLENAKNLINKCLDYFEEHLVGYDPTYAVFNFPFNSSTPELETFALSRVRAVRTRGAANNPIPHHTEPLILGCSAFGPGNGDLWMEEQINSFLNEPGGWLILNLHGLDDEGWGPISAGYLEETLQKLSQIQHLEIMPAGAVLKRTLD